jgi:hypothetical protein
MCHGRPLAVQHVVRTMPISCHCYPQVPTAPSPQPLPPAAMPHAGGPVTLTSVAPSAAGPIALLGLRSSGTAVPDAASAITSDSPSPPAAAGDASAAFARPAAPPPAVAARDQTLQGPSQTSNRVSGQPTQQPCLATAHCYLFCTNKGTWKDNMVACIHFFIREAKEEANFLSCWFGVSTIPGDWHSCTRGQRIIGMFRTGKVVYCLHAVYIQYTVGIGVNKIDKIPKKASLGHVDP